MHTLVLRTTCYLPPLPEPFRCQPLRPQHTSSSHIPRGHFTLLPLQRDTTLPSYMTALPIHPIPAIFSAAPTVPVPYTFHGVIAHLMPVVDSFVILVAYRYLCHYSPSAFLSTPDLPCTYGWRCDTAAATSRYFPFHCREHLDTACWHCGYAPPAAY